MKIKKIALLLSSLCLSDLTYATNGMNMEGYGPIALGMGGASMAYDNGTAAVMNNPATIGLMKDRNRVDLALGFMSPDVSTQAGNSSASSSADFFWGPAFGWVQKADRITYGVGVYGQGGMGTEYSTGSFMGMGQSLTNRSELSVGRLIFPLAFNANRDFTIGGSLDVVWAGLDLQMLVPASQMGAMAVAGDLNASGAGAAALPPFIGGANNFGYFDFTNDNDFSGKARATGMAGKLGATYRLNEQLTVGATYHSKTHLPDLDADASMHMIDNSGTMGPAGSVYSLSGKIRVVNFQWPETYALGFAYQANDRLFIAADYKRIEWAGVMQNFQMNFSTSDMGGLVMDMKLNQEWENQNVWMLGLAYKASPLLTLRAGVNLANNPVPDSYMSPLFPAIIRNHFTFGFGYQINPASSIDLAYSHAPEVSVSNSATGIGVDHAQNNGQLIYSYRF